MKTRDRRGLPGRFHVALPVPMPSHLWLRDPNLEPHRHRLPPPILFSMQELDLPRAQALPAGHLVLPGPPQGTGGRDTFHTDLRTEITFASLKIILRNTSISAAGFARDINTATDSEKEAFLQ